MNNEHKNTLNITNKWKNQTNMKFIKFCYRRPAILERDHKGNLRKSFFRQTFRIGAVLVKKIFKKFSTFFLKISKIPKKCP